MGSPFDIVVLDAAGRITLGVGVNAHSIQPSAVTAARWVQEIRDAVFAGIPSDEHPAFLLATPGAFFFWKAGLSQTERAALGDLATYEWMVQADDILKPYFTRAGVRPGKAIDPGVFELIVWWWLGDVAAGIAKRHPNLEAQGFYKALAGGHVELRAAA
ncbi:MAG: hypothetical protein LUO89_12920 [Methanothrix sp.]|nr:hypothetical protein [Methanothrix sp.]